MHLPHIPQPKLATWTCLLFVNTASAAVNIDYVLVGNAGNTNDPTTGYGSVAYKYQISKNETTISQYADFLNTKAKTDSFGLYNTAMTTDLNSAGITRSGVSGSYTYSVISGAGNRPITYVSWFDAARFANWLHNGQGNGSTETGAYTLAGATSGVSTAGIRKLGMKMNFCMWQMASTTTLLLMMPMRI